MTQMDDLLTRIQRLGEEDTTAGRRETRAAIEASPFRRWIVLLPTPTDPKAPRNRHEYRALVSRVRRGLPR